MIHQRASWALDKRELEALQHRARKHGLFVKDDTFAEAKAESFAEFKNRYINVTERISKSVVNTGEGGKITLKSIDSMKLSSRYLNKNDELYQRAAKIKPLEGFDDIVVHGDPYGFVFIDSDGAETNISALEFAKILRTDDNYKGGDIRLIACQVGAGDGVVPQCIANELNVNVLAPTEIVNVDFEGNIILADNETNARAGIETGEWKLFKPKGR